mmetsp:Transcript_1348/g.2166  ORF Transcript_1348/g.2166 Transcript_1348/m.2166 type:complete len:481 (-) Transcript_1348:79-1521(-)
MMVMATNGAPKMYERVRRGGPTDTPSQSTFLIYDLLPGGMLKEVANYLQAPSRILFAIAITPPVGSPYDIIMSRCRPRVRHSSIEGNDWHTLDFGDIEEDLAAKLSDDDISKALLHIDAANKVKRLRLTNCVNINGSGLSPLFGCTSIEQIDLSLVGAHKLPQLDPEPALSDKMVLPILHSIISQESNSLKHLQFPHSWRSEEYYSFRFHEFLERYDEMLDNSTMSCCSTRLGSGLILFSKDWYGIQDWTCSECTKYYCYECTDKDGIELLHFCQTCERNYCTACAAMVQCSTCDDYLCVDCAPHIACPNSTCSNELICKDCRTECEECKKSWCYSCMDCGLCEDCSRACCRSCSDKEGANGVHWCDVCTSNICDDCRVKECKSGENNCNDCVKIISTKLLEENKKMQAQISSLKDENKGKQNLLQANKKMQVENKELRNEIKRLKYANNALWDQNTHLGGEVEELTQKMNTIRMLASSF